MHEAYEVNQLLKLTVQIESITAYGRYFECTVQGFSSILFHSR